MSSPILTDEELEKEKDLFNMDNKKQSTKQSLESIIKNRDKIDTEKIEVDKSTFVKSDIVEKTEEEIEKDIPSNYIEINLISNGRIEGIPDKLHFRCYSASDALDLNVDDEDKIKAVTKVLTRLNYEKFDVSLLTIQDILFILYKMHGAFISPKITRKVYIDDTITDEEKLNDPDNLEEVDIYLNSMVYAYLGKDYNDVDYEKKIKVPFTIKDNTTKDLISFKFTTLKDILTAQTYCKNYFKNEFIKYGDVRSTIAKIRGIRNDERQDEALEQYLSKNEDKVTEYYDFMAEYTKMIAEVTQALTIVSYNGQKLDKIEDKWDVYVNKLSFDIWENYNKVIEDYPFGFKEDIDVYLKSLKKTVHRRVGFQLDDFIHIDGHENTDRYTVEFD